MYRYITRCCVCKCIPGIAAHSHPVIRPDQRTGKPEQLFSYISCNSAYCLWRAKLKVDAYPVIDLWPWRCRLGPTIVFFPKSVCYLDGI